MIRVLTLGVWAPAGLATVLLVVLVVTTASSPRAPAPTAPPSSSPRGTPTRHRIPILAMPGRSAAGSRYPVPYAGYLSSLLHAERKQTGVLVVADLPSATPPCRPSAPRAAHSGAPARLRTVTILRPPLGS